MIDSLYNQAREADIAVAGFYCDFLTQKELTITHMMGAILKELIGRDIPEYLREAFRKESVAGGLLLDRLIELLGSSSLPQAFICIDALDECLLQNLPKLLMSLRAIVLKSPKTRIFLTGRPHVSEAIHRWFGNVVAMPIRPNTDDIKRFLKMKLDEDVELDGMTQDLRVEIVRVFLDKMSDT